MRTLDTDLAWQEALALAMHLPEASTDEIVGLLKVLVRLSFARRIRLGDLADSLTYDEERLLSLLELLEILGFAEMADATVKLTRMGRQYARAAEHGRRLIFADQLAERIPLVSYVRGLLERNPGRDLTLIEIEADLHERVGASQAAPALRQVIAWARYAGLFLFDARTGSVSLRPPGDSRPP